MKTHGLLKQYTSVTVAIQRVIDPLIALGTLYFIAQRQSYTWNHIDWYFSGFVFLLIMLVFGGLNLYRSWRAAKLRQEIQSIVAGWFFVLIILVTFFVFVFRPQIFSENIFTPWAASVPIILSIERFFLRIFLRELRKRGVNKRTAIIIGTTTLGEKFYERAKQDGGSGLDIIGFFDDSHMQGKRSFCDRPLIGTLADVAGYVTRNNIDIVYITLPFHSDGPINELLENLSTTPASVFLIPDLLVYQLLSTRMYDFDGFPMIGIFDIPLQGIDGYLKRGLDLLAASIVILLILPLLLVIAIGIKLTSRGPVIFKQKRYGINDEEIIMYKFRSMTVMESGNNFKQATKNDPRITPFGKFLRQTSLDELPQFFNVIQGTMSLVGPRPHPALMDTQYRTKIRGYTLRRKVKPGITGWAQINGWRGETDTLDKMEKRIEFDLFYIRNWSLWLDIKILFMTLFKGFKNSNAY